MFLNFSFILLTFKVIHCSFYDLTFSNLHEFTKFSFIKKILVDLQMKFNLITGILNNNNNNDVLSRKIIIISKNLKKFNLKFVLFIALLAIHGIFFCKTYYLKHIETSRVHLIDCIFWQLKLASC